MNKELTMIKIIDLLNKEANSEKMPEKIKYKDTVYIYSNYYKDYVEKNSEIRIEAGTGLLQNIELLKCLNNYVEILEEDEDIEEIENYPDVLDWKEEYGIDRALKEQSEFNEKVFNRLNELSKEVNKLRKESK